ncbi:MAG: type III polyketide synthase [Candidatus Eremiobacteraeota bacterium]|nr:3-oxoacyl-[acyl-carrier-protein] synthase III C-terminal domain-containing protein [Candidatus Eremiobacteraeota bacterium]NNM93647.1 type III polyketide synthase [Candidatus Eremiobacteraeota bacterium]
MIPVHLNAVATAVPPNVLEQGDIERRVRAQFADSAVVARLLPVFANTGIERRYSCVPVEWYYDEHRWADRNALYRTSALALVEEAATSALARAGLAPEAIDAIVSVSTTGIATPSLEALLMERIPFGRRTARVPIVGLGCVGGALGLARAADLVRSGSFANVLFIGVECCTLWFRRNEITKSNIVATALFGDGAAAAVLSRSGSGAQIAAAGEYTFPHSLDIMGWDVADDGLQAIFSRDIPALIGRELRAILDDFLARNDLRIDEIDAFLSHPGGTKVLDALEATFGVAPGSLTDSRAVLRDYGNMSSVTLLFVLERALREGAFANASRGRALLSAMGPGFTAAFLTLER